MARKRGTYMLNPLGLQVKPGGSSKPCPGKAVLVAPSSYCKRPRRKAKAGKRSGSMYSYAKKFGWDANLLVKAPSEKRKAKRGRPAKAKAKAKSKYKSKSKAKTPRKPSASKLIEKYMVEHYGPLSTLNGLGATRRRKKTTRRRARKTRLGISSWKGHRRAHQKAAKKAWRTRRLKKRICGVGGGVGSVFDGMGAWYNDTRGHRKASELGWRRRKYGKRRSRKVAGLSATRGRRKARKYSRRSKHYVMGLGGELLEINPRHRRLYGADPSEQFTTDYQYALMNAESNPLMPSSVQHVFSMDTAVNLGGLALGRSLATTVGYLAEKYLLKAGASNNMRLLTHAVADVVSALLSFELGKMVGGLRYGSALSKMMSLGALAGIPLAYAQQLTTVGLDKVFGGVTGVAGIGRYTTGKEVGRTIGAYGLEPERRSIGRYGVEPERRAIGEGPSSGVRAGEDVLSGSTFTSDECPDESEAEIASQFANDDLIPIEEVDNPIETSSDGGGEEGGLGSVDDSPF